MATLNIRRLPEDVHAKLRVRAAKAGRSMEAEACRSGTVPVSRWGGCAISLP
jgi:plasmid stability protein